MRATDVTAKLLCVYVCLLVRERTRSLTQQTTQRTHCFVRRMSSRVYRLIVAADPCLGFYVSETVCLTVCLCTTDCPLVCEVRWQLLICAHL